MTHKITRCPLSEPLSVTWIQRSVDLQFKHLHVAADTPYRNSGISTVAPVTNHDKGGKGFLHLTVISSTTIASKQRWRIDALLSDVGQCVILTSSCFQTSLYMSVIIRLCFRIVYKNPLTVFTRFLFSWCLTLGLPECLRFYLGSEFASKKDSFFFFFDFGTRKNLLRVPFFSLELFARKTHLEVIFHSSDFFTRRSSSGSTLLL